MAAPQTAARTAAVLGAATALTVAGAGAAMATITAPDINGEARTVSVSFTLEEGQSSDLCGAVLTPAASAPRVAAEFAGGDLRAIFGLLAEDPNVITLESGGLVRLPFVTPNRLPLVGSPTGTVSANDVRPDVYALVSICLSDRENPEIRPVVMGNPLEAAQGSLETGSAELDIFVEDLLEEYGS
jgi:hypothetical protein